MIETNSKASVLVAFVPSAALDKLRNGRNNSPTVLTDGPTEFNDTPLYTVPPAAAVVLPERENENGFENEQSEQAIGFNRALEEVARLNPTPDHVEHERAMVPEVRKLNEKNSRVIEFLNEEAVLYQRRSQIFPSGWVDCSKEEATKHTAPNYDYRALVLAKPKLVRVATGIVEAPKPGRPLDEIDQKIISFADKRLSKQWESDDEGHGYFYASDVARMLGIDKRTVKSRIELLAESGHLRAVNFVNGRAWRSINLLPFEVQPETMLAAAPAPEPASPQTDAARDVLPAQGEGESHE